MSQRARAVNPWTWARVLRDQGPKSRDFLCAMLTLRTWMDSSGFTFTGIRAWAEGARMSVNTLQKHRTAALAKGWLAAEKRRDTKGWRTPALRCTVPVHVELPKEKDDELKLVLDSQFADIEDADTASDTASDTAKTRSPPTPVTHVTLHDAVSIGHSGAPMLYQNSPEKAVCCITAVSVESCNPLAALETPPEVLEAIKRSYKRKTEGRAAGDTSGVSVDTAPGKRTIPDTNNPSPALLSIRRRTGRNHH